MGFTPNQEGSPGTGLDRVTLLRVLNLPFCPMLFPVLLWAYADGSGRGWWLLGQGIIWAAPTAMPHTPPQVRKAAFIT